ncbi:MAG: hypothetical protein J6K61_05070 [Clostridia bacterium]|nr:hypothetical protein [Clostridia bacterium]
MYRRILQLMERDEAIIETIQKQRKGTLKARIRLAIYLIPAAFLFLAFLRFPLWAVLAVSGAYILYLSFAFLDYRFKKPKIYFGPIGRIAHKYSYQAAKGTLALGRSHSRVCEVHILQISIITDEKHPEKARVISCQPQYERVLQEKEVILYHSFLPYPALLSDPRECICMHCGTMQTPREHCYSCGKRIYNFHIEGEMGDVFHFYH